MEHEEQATGGVGTAYDAMSPVEKLVHDLARLRALRPIAGTMDQAAMPEGRDGALYWRALPDGFEVVVYPMTYGKVRLCYGDQGPCGFILNAYCYESPSRAIEAAEVWDGSGDPLDGWHRNPMTGRRRPHGNPDLEYVAP